jgi:hypothetical protein
MHFGVYSARIRGVRFAAHVITYDRDNMENYGGKVSSSGSSEKPGNSNV